MNLIVKDMTKDKFNRYNNYKAIDKPNRYNNYIKSEYIIIYSNTPRQSKREVDGH